MVDQQGLTTWKVDTKAMVMAAGGKWRPLKDLLAMQEAAAKYAAQSAADPHVAALPLVPPPPRETKFPRPPTPTPAEPPPPVPASPPVSAPRPPASGPRPPTSAPLRAPAPPAPPVVEPVVEPSPMIDLASVIESSPAIEPSAIDEPSPVLEPPPIIEPEPRAALSADAIEPDPGLAGPELATDEGPPIVAADFRAAAEELAPPVDTFASSAAAETPEIASNEPFDPQAWADDEPAIFTTVPEGESATETGDVVAGEDEVPTALPEPAAGSDRGWDPEPSQWPDAVEAPAIAARSSAVQSIADDPTPRYEYAGEVPVVGEKPEGRSSPDEAPAYASSGPGFEEDDEEFLKPRPIVLDERFVRVLSTFGAVLSRALDVLSEVFGWVRGLVQGRVEAFREAREARAARAAAAPLPPTPSPAPSSAAGPEPELVEDPSPSYASSYSPIAEPPPQIQSFADEPTPADEATPAYEASPTYEPSSAYETTPSYEASRSYEAAPVPLVPVEDVPVIPLKPIDDEGPRGPSLVDRLRGAASAVGGWALALRGRVEALFHRERPRPIPAAPERPWSSERLESSVGYAPPAPPRKAPPPVTELPVIRLQKIEEPEEPADLYEGEVRESHFPVVWLWTKRLLLTGALAAVAFVAYQRWDALSPKATDLSKTAFTEVSKYVENREQKQREQRALEDSTAQIPHLAPETIRLVLSRSTSGVPDPPEVFQVASNAADRGESALTSEEREELKTLRRELLSTLSPGERERVQEYDDVRSRRIPFAFEDKSALDLVARGARALPEESRERLQTLVGKAVASGLAAPVPNPTAKVAR
jgi:hypothetical protein